MSLFLLTLLLPLSAGEAATAREAAPAYELVGCARRSILWHDLYDLTLFRGPDDAEAIVMEVLHDGKMPKGLPDDWPPRLSRTLSEEEIAEIDAAFALIEPRSRVEIAYAAEADASTMAIDGEPVLTVPARRTYEAVRSMWLGDDPISEGLKRRLLSGECGG
jgi:hypothetical protein